MADPSSIATGALKASTTLYQLIQSFRSQNKDARALKEEVNKHNRALEALLEIITINPTLDFKALELPLKRCGHACEEYRKFVEKCTQLHNDRTPSGVCDWITQQYLQGDIKDFKRMIAAYNATINVALAIADL